jgi:hypothetical protein
LALVIIPSEIVAASFAASASIPVLLLALSRQPILIRDLRKRFRLASMLAIALWAGLMLSGKELWRFDAQALSDVIAGAMIISSCILTILILLLLVAAGVSTTLLVSLSTKPRPVDIEPWLADYGGGFGVEDLFRDRLNLLLGTGAAVIRQSTLTLARHARLPVALLEAAMLYFNLPKPMGG